MAEQVKPAPPTQEHPYPPPTIVPYPHQAYNGPYPPPGPPGTYMPPFFAYPPPPDGSHPEGGQNGVPPGPYMIGLPPGVVYAYPSHPQAQPPPASASAPAALARPKRKQVKMACTNCAGACKRCDETRPCERCVKYGIADTCIDGQRKERKKGIKRGPYKRKAKGEGETASFNGDWPNGTPPSSTAAAPGLHPVPPQYAPEGYYPIYYPPPGFMPHPHDGQPGSDGSPPQNGQPIMPYYIHPGSYQFPHYPPIYPPGAPPPPGAQPAPSASQATQAAPEPPQTVNPSDTGRKDDPAPAAERNGVEAAAAGKKRSRTTKNGEPKTKKTKTAVNGTPVPAAVPAAPAHTEKDKHESPQAANGDGDEHSADGASRDGDLDKSA